MKTPIYDFIKEYESKNALRLHMPGHKGKDGMAFDVTEINGADSLYEASGIIAESEENASSLFGCKTLYSTEGSSHCIRAMMHLTSLYASEKGEKCRVLAFRNAHKAFLSAAALVDFDLEFLDCDGYLSLEYDLEKLEAVLSKERFTALYVTSPDYLGRLAPIKELADICKKYGVMLAVDNAHGAYLKFLPSSLHPIDLGADIVCDSAHKTLPVLTGGAYLHINKDAPSVFFTDAKDSLSLFGSTSPSYTVMSSLDLCNRYLEDYPSRLSYFIRAFDTLKKDLTDNGYVLYGDEKLKLTLKTKPYGYFGYEFAAILEEKGAICEFYDKDFVVMMLSAEQKNDLEDLKKLLLSIPKRQAVTEIPPIPKAAVKVMSPREAVMSPKESVPVAQSLGRILASPSVGCPPAVPILISGEVIDENALRCFEYYGIKQVLVVK